MLLGPDNKSLADSARRGDGMPAQVAATASAVVTSDREDTWPPGWPVWLLLKGRCTAEKQQREGGDVRAVFGGCGIG